MRSRDTADAADHVQLQIVRAMSPAERVRVAVAMSEDARQITAAGIRARHPEWSTAQVRRELLVRLYGIELVGCPRAARHRRSESSTAPA